MFRLTYNTFQNFLFKIYYIHVYIMHLLNLFKNHIVHYMFRPTLVIIRCFKNFSVETDVLPFFPSNVECVGP
jgi:hypothetical protein